jgi:hypothetical protein
LTSSCIKHVIGNPEGLSSGFLSKSLFWSRIVAFDGFGSLSGHKWWVWLLDGGHSGGSGKETFGKSLGVTVELFSIQGADYVEKR